MREHEKHKVHETHKRSVAKGITARLIEVAVDTIILSLLGMNPFASLGVSVGIEALCFLSTYLNERLWNRVSWGRKIEHG